MSPRQIEILKSEVNKMLELKIIEPGESDFTSPLILVEAQGKEARPCIDYRRLNKVTRTQFLPLPNIEELLEKCNASNLGIGVVLSQVCENEEHPIMFLSKKLSLAEQKYSTTEKECAAIIFAVQKLKCYLEGHQKFVPWSVKIILDRVISDRKERERSKLEEKKGKQKKAELAQVPKKDWVDYLLAVLPVELSNMLAREPTE
ncbi:retrovirus-related Pol polyprotein from transposon 17.6 [Trichonephila clavipes]|nr:retrovirus-related Pol polyprotein from transposon 17.6 [Trichonephila clavipes]